VQAVGALLGAWIVWEITLRQARLQERDPAPTRDQLQGVAVRGAAPYEIVRGPDGMPVAGWYPDPNGVYQHRYWDGRGWTEHVSTNGVSGTAPVVPASVAAPVETAPAETAPAETAIAADWYPDPSGRHQWRFWGGDAWTPHVNDDGVHSDDALDRAAPPPVVGESGVGESGVG
jgi:hypothetical protein